MNELIATDYVNLYKLLDRVRDIQGIDDARVIAILASKLQAAAEAADAPAEESNDDVPTDD
jgi:hypothetical protein